MSDIFLESAKVLLILGGAPLLGSMCVGLFVSILQSATQIQEQTLTLVPKLIVASITCWFSWQIVGDQFIELTQNALGSPTFWKGITY